MFISRAVITKLKHLLGSQNVMNDPVSLALNGYDCSPSRLRPDLVLAVQRMADLEPLVQLLAREHIPFLVRAAATNHAGGCAAVRGGAVININALNQIENINTQQSTADVQPGVITGVLQEQAAAQGFFYAPDPASEHVCTLGGNLAQNASGARCLKYGNTCDNTLQAEFITPDGEIHLLRHDNPGPDWLGLIAGSEGTLGIIKRMQVKLLPKPPRVKTFLAAFDSLENCIQTVTDLAARGITPRCVEAMDRTVLQAVENFTHAGYPDAAALLILELDGTRAQIKQQAAQLQAVCRQNQCTDFTMAGSEAEREKLWEGRRAAYSAMAALAPNVAVGDGTVPRSQLPAALKQVQQIIAKHAVHAGLLFHAGDGNFHPQFVYDAASTVQTQAVHKALQEVLKTCVDVGGSVSGEHGIGIEKRAVMAYQYSRETLRLFQKIKQAFDPDNLANPDKIIPVNFEEKARAAVTQDPAVLALQQEVRRRFALRQTSRVTGEPAPGVPSEILSTQTLARIVDIDKVNYTATVQTGVAVQPLLAALQRQNIYTRLPADYAGTLGGVLATKAAPDFMTQLTGLEAILPDGDLIQYGGKLMKNAAGYNLCRLFSGSWGALGVITQVTFKIYATPQQVSAPADSSQAAQTDPLFAAVKKEIDPHGLFHCAVLEKDQLWQHAK